MNIISSLLDGCRAVVRILMKRMARVLDTLSKGRITPNSVTITALIAHLPIAWLIANGQLVLAGLLLIVFGLFDTLDGQLAKLQKRESAVGMFLDSTTDRIKEVLLYCGIIAYLLGRAEGIVIIAAVGALGASLVTSYINAWGEVALASSPKKHTHKVNEALRTGLGGFEVRISLLIIGLIFNQLEAVIYILLVLATLTVMQRIRNTVQRL